MPVNLLLCEGGTNSPDIRVLGKLLAGICEIRPMGGKYGMGERIKARREILGGNVVFGLLDGDFQVNWELPQNRPRDWIVRKNKTKVLLGWRWERKEIENYLIDPVVVQLSLVIMHRAKANIGRRSNPPGIKFPFTRQQGQLSALAARVFTILLPALENHAEKKSTLFPTNYMKKHAVQGWKRLLSIIKILNWLALSK